MVNANDWSQGTEIYGLNVDASNNITYREWAPNAVAASIVGDFSKRPSPASRAASLRGSQMTYG